MQLFDLKRHTSHYLRVRNAIFAKHAWMNEQNCNSVDEMRQKRSICSAEKPFLQNMHGRTSENEILSTDSGKFSFTKEKSDEEDALHMKKIEGGNNESNYFQGKVKVGVILTMNAGKDMYEKWYKESMAMQLAPPK